MKRPDWGLVLGVAIAAGAAVVGIASTGVGLHYFLQPTGAVIVLGGTLGVMLVTTPGPALAHAAGRIASLFSNPRTCHEALVEEIIYCARVARQDGILALEKLAPDRFLHGALLLAIDVGSRAELQTALETELRLRERQGEADAKALEVAGGYAPALGILGTVVGLIQVLRQFSDLAAVGHGIGTAFVSTIYGLALANLVLLPMAHRIRARTAEIFERDELILEGVLCIFDRVHPAMMRTRLGAFLRNQKSPAAVSGGGAEEHATA